MIVRKHLQADIYDCKKISITIIFHKGSIKYLCSDNKKEKKEREIGWTIVLPFLGRIGFIRATYLQPKWLDSFISMQETWTKISCRVSRVNLVVMHVHKTWRQENGSTWLSMLKALLLNIPAFQPKARSNGCSHLKFVKHQGTWVETLSVATYS